MDDYEPVPVFLPQIGDAENAAVLAALKVGYLGLGPATARFEAGLGSWLGLAAGRSVTATSSCTAALHLAALLAGAGPGTEVICPSFTYVAAHQAVSMTGADVVFCDIDPDTLAIDPERVAELVTERTVAVMTCHYAGHVGEIEALYSVARQHGLRVIEDAAHALGSLLPDGRAVGAAGDLVAFSFGPVKTITTLEGGALLTSDPHEDRLNRERRMLGADMDLDARMTRERFWEYDVVRQGYRYHLGTVPASVGLAQLEQLDGFVARRQEYCAQYDRELRDVPGLQMMGWDWSRIGPFIYVVQIEPADRDALMAHLRNRGIAANVHWGQGGHTFTQYRNARRSDLPVTERACKRVVTLPLWSHMPDDVRARVIEGVRSFYGW